ncbi:unnamed protein product [Phytomonas sp. Hart1]|nr:unnamed protein product [Phytomonas sp. Hart1]|eukprot:CCW68329.1 unnamed protein product [Phytomonas sp. isolate Hart1]
MPMIIDTPCGLDLWKNIQVGSVCSGVGLSRSFFPYYGVSDPVYPLVSCHIFLNHVFARYLKSTFQSLRSPATLSFSKN